MNLTMPATCSCSLADPGKVCGTQPDRSDSSASDQPDLVGGHCRVGLNGTARPDDGHVGRRGGTQPEMQGQVVAGTQTGAALDFLHLHRSAFRCHRDTGPNRVSVHPLATDQAHGQPVMAGTVRALVAIEREAFIPLRDDEIHPLVPIIVGVGRPHGGTGLLQPGFGRHILEGTVLLIVIEIVLPFPAVPSGLVRLRSSVRGWLPGMKWIVTRSG